MITCNKCKGKVFVDLTFDSTETFCLRCGKRTFSHQMSNEVYQLVSDYKMGKLNGVNS